ncbi:MAG: RpiB/LacA/LacB family sugar-phosphate isomerase [Lutibacter sp.]
MNTISCLFLDIGGVLLSNGWDSEFRQRAVMHFHLEAAEMDARHSLFFDTFEEGRITIDEYLDKVVFYTKRDFTHIEFKDFMFSLSTPNLEMIAFIKKIKLQYGLKVIAVSNEAREINAYRIKAFKLNEIFDFFVSSCYVHLRKPDAAIFRLAIDAAQVPINEIVYIDNMQMFTDVAMDLGITSIYHTNFLSTSKALANLGLSVKQGNTYPTSNLKEEITDPKTRITSIGVASDHGGFELKVQLVALLKTAGYEVKDFGAHQLNDGDDFPDYVIPMAKAIANGEVTRGIAICGSGVGACIAANKIGGVRSALITDSFSAHQGVEDDNMNIMCLGGRITGPSLAWELVQLFLNARFKNEERFLRRLGKITLLERNKD